MERVKLETSGKIKATHYSLKLQNIATYVMAQEYCVSAKRTKSSVVRAYLLAHALELYLKSFLLSSGHSARTLKSKPYGHNLTVLLNQATLDGLDKVVSITPQIKEDTKKLNLIYPETLRYFSLISLLSQPKIPPLSELFLLAKALSKALKKLLDIKT